MLAILLDFKAYHLVEQVDRYSYEGPEDKQVIDRLFNEYPFSERKRPIFIREICKYIDNKFLTTGELILKFISINSEHNNSDFEVLKEIFQEVTQRIYLADTLQDIDQNINWHLFLNFIPAKEEARALIAPA